jgi:HTH-type transcriptional regulator/antitoxin HigA
MNNTVGKVEAMSTLTIDDRKYQKLLGRVLPVVIRSESEYGRLLKAAEELIEAPENELSAEEGRLLELLSMLIEEYEDRVRPLPKTDPGKMLVYLLGERGLKPADLAAVLPKSRVSEIVAGKRAISKEQAKALAEFFNVPVDLFL